MFEPKYALLAFCAMTLPGASKPPLTGEWAGDRARLTLSTMGGRIEYDCGSGTISGPLWLDAKSQFKAGGMFEEYTPGPAPADGRHQALPTVYRGTVDGETLTLDVRTAGSPAPRVFHLVRGKQIKLIRCY